MFDGLFSRRVTGWDDETAWCELPEPTAGCTYHGKDMSRSRLTTGERLMRMGSKPNVRGFRLPGKDTKGPNR